MKKIFSVILALTFIFSFGILAFGETTQPTQHTYTLYKIFTGTQVPSVDPAQLAKIEWDDDDVNGDELLSALKSDSTLGSYFTSCSSAGDVAAVIGVWTDDSTEARAFARLVFANKKGSGTAYTSGETLNAGYYLVVDTTAFAEDETGTVKNLALLQMTEKGEFEIATKAEAPVIEKKVKDINDSTDAAKTDWQDSADYDIGDIIPFKLTATLKDISAFNTYKLVFNDTGCAGLTVKADSFSVKIDNDEALTDDKYTVSISGNNFTVTINDVKANGAKNNSVVTVEYTAELNNSAAIGSAGNPNVVYLQYSNNPNYVSESATPQEQNTLGKTVTDKVIVFTYQLDVTKLSQVAGEVATEALSGAGFTLYKQTYSSDEGTKTTVNNTEYDGKWEKVGDEIKNEGGNSFSWKGVDDGNYILVESTVPAGYNPMTNLQFTVTATHDITADNPTLTDLDGGDKVTGTAGTGVLASDVINIAKGATLPETGGRGTTIFYIVGSILLVGAAILLVTKKFIKE